MVFKIFQRLMFTRFKSSTAKEVTKALVSNSTLGSAFPNLVTLASAFPNLVTLASAFPNLVTLASIVSILPVTTATVERSFSNMKLVKTRLRNQIGDDTLDQAMRVCIEGPERLSNESLETIIDHWKEQKTRRLLV